MQFNEKTLRTLEFDKIREMLAACSLTDGARELALTLTPSAHTSVILKNQRRTSDAKRLINSKGVPSFGGVRDMRDICERAEKGAVLSARELLDVANLLRTTRALLDYIRTNKTFETSLDEIFERLIPDKKTEDSIYRAIIAEDLIADEASEKLSDIRRKIKTLNNKIKDLLSKYTSGVYSKYLQENIVTQRSGRYVVPVKIEHRSDVKGLVHDTSSSGATLFIEPIAVVEANNGLRELEAAEKHEIERILAALSAQVDGISGAVRLNYQNITELAFIFACGELSVRLRGVSPMISGERTVSLHRARHPLIDREKVVPINIEISKGRDTLIITGPNTGGKTVTLKTLGLFALMTQSGLHIPAEDPSSICVFDDVLADIGDEQSIEQSLSTFSAHMVNIVSIMRRVTNRSLVLFDELGVGTDPIEGAALAVAIIESVRERGAVCVSTTHYAELKAYALETDGVENASCEFDVETLRPTYKLIIGTPGKSNAFAISKKLGLPEEIIRRAEHSVSPDSKRFERVIEQLEKSRIEMDNDREAAAAMRLEYEKFKAEAEKKLFEKTARVERELEKAQEKAQAIVESAKASSDFIFAQLDRAKRAKESDKLSEELERARREVRSHIKQNEDKFNPVDEAEDDGYRLPRPLVKGDHVYIRNIGTSGSVLELPDKSGNVLVQAGAARTKTHVSNLKLIEDGETMVTNRDNKRVPASEYQPKTVRQFSPEIDLRGMTGEEAWYAVDRFIDEGQMVNITTLHLIHGKGTGALKNALWRFLQTDRRIASYRLGRHGEGDGGVTIIELK